MADGGFVHTGAVTRRIDGARMVFQRLDGLWMIDRLGDPANDVSSEELDATDVLDRDAHAGDLATAIARGEVAGLDEASLRSFHARQLRKLGLHQGSSAADALWRLITDFDRFDPWVA